MTIKPKDIDPVGSMATENFFNYTIPATATGILSHSADPFRYSAVRSESAFKRALYGRA